MTVFEAQAAARAAGLDRFDAQLMLSRLLDRSRAWLVAHDDAVLDAAQQARLAAWIARRADGEPMAYLLGEKEFHGLSLRVDRSVLVPRPDTETLVEWALERMQAVAAATGASPRVADLGTGSGAIALALKHAMPGATVCAVDASLAALDVARANASRLALDVEFVQSDWLAGLPSRRFDLLVSNPPYIAEHDPHLPDLSYEPRQALVSGHDGLDDIRRIVSGAPGHLAPGGWLLLEHGFDQAAPVRALLAASGYLDVGGRDDLAGHARCSGGRRA